MSLHISSIRGMSFDEFMRQHPAGQKPKIRKSLHFATTWKKDRKRKLEVENEPKKPAKVRISGSEKETSLENLPIVNEEQHVTTASSLWEPPLHGSNHLLQRDDSLMSLNSSSVFIHPPSGNISPLASATKWQAEHSTIHSDNPRRQDNSMGSIRPLDLSVVKKSSPPQRKHRPASTVEFSSPEPVSSNTHRQAQDERLSRSRVLLSAIVKGWKARYRFHSRRGTSMRSQLMDTLRFMDSIEREGDPANVALYEQLKKQLNTIQGQFIRFMSTLDVPFVEQQQMPRTHHANGTGVADPSTIVISETSPHQIGDRAMTPPLKRISKSKIARSSRKVDNSENLRDVVPVPIAKRRMASKSVPRTIPSRSRSRRNSQKSESSKRIPEGRSRTNTSREPRTIRAASITPKRTRRKSPASSQSSSRHHSHTSSRNDADHSPEAAQQLRLSPRAPSPGGTDHATSQKCHHHRQPSFQMPPNRPIPASSTTKTKVEQFPLLQYQCAVNVDRLYAADTKIFNQFAQHSFRKDNRSKIPQLSLEALFHKYADKPKKIDDRLMRMLQDYSHDYLNVSDFVRKQQQSAAKR